MPQTVDKLAKQAGKIRAGDVTDGSVERFMSLVRQLLEERRQTQKYKIAMLYCNWSTHPKLDRSPEGGALLDIVDEILVPTRPGPIPDETIELLLSDMSLIALRAELVALFLESLIDPSLLWDEAVLTQMMLHLLGRIAAKPIARKPGQVERLRKARIAQGSWIMAEGLRILPNDGDPASKLKFMLRLESRAIVPDVGGKARLVMPWPIAIDPSGAPIC